MEKQTLTTVTTVLARGDEPSITISTIALDRESDEIVSDGVGFAAYMKNPIVLFGHDYSGLPVGTTTRLDVSGTNIRASWKWLENDEFASRVRNAYDQGMLRAASIGFRPLEWTRNEHGGRRYTKCELLEWSLVAVPANAAAVRQLKALDLWRDDDVVLDVADDEPVVLELVDEPHGTDEVATDCSPQEIAAMLGREFAAGVAREIGTAVQRELQRRRGSVVDPVDDRVYRRVNVSDFNW